MSDHLAPLFSEGEANQPIPELIRLGEQLARARHQAGLSPEDLSRRLHLEPRQLKALETGDHTLLPAGVFVVAMARRVAGALHTDVEEAIVAVRHSRLMRRPAPGRPPTPEAPSPLEASPPLPSPPISVDGPAGASTTPPLPWPVMIAGVLAACGLGAAFLLSQRSAPPRPVPSLPSEVKAPPPVSGTPGAPARPAPTRTPSPVVAAQAPPPVAANTLRLNASEPSWVEVRDVAGTTLFNGTLTGEKRFPIGRGLEVLAGRPYAVTAAIGAEPAIPLGGVADIQWKRFSTKGTPTEPPRSPAP